LRITEPERVSSPIRLGGSLTNHQAASRNEGRSKIKGKLPVRIDVAHGTAVSGPEDPRC